MPTVRVPRKPEPMIGKVANHFNFPLPVGAISPQRLVTAAEAENVKIEPIKFVFDLEPGQEKDKLEVEITADEIREIFAKEQVTTNMQFEADAAARRQLIVGELGPPDTTDPLGQPGWSFKKVMAAVKKVFSAKSIRETANKYFMEPLKKAVGVTSDVVLAAEKALDDMFPAFERVSKIVAEILRMVVEVVYRVAVAGFNVVWGVATTIITLVLVILKIVMNIVMLILKIVVKVLVVALAKLIGWAIKAIAAAPVITGVVTAIVGYLGIGWMWGYISNQLFKSNIQEMTGRLGGPGTQGMTPDAVLRNLGQLTMYSYVYSGDETRAIHYGPMADDWYKTFTFPQRSTTDIPYADRIAVNMLALSSASKQIDDLTKRVKALELMMRAGGDKRAREDEDYIAEGVFDDEEPIITPVPSQDPDDGAGFFGMPSSTNPTGPTATVPAYSPLGPFEWQWQSSFDETSRPGGQTPPGTTSFGLRGMDVDDDDDVVDGGASSSIQDGAINDFAAGDVLLGGDPQYDIPKLVPFVNVATISRVDAKGKVPDQALAVIRGGYFVVYGAKQFFQVIDDPKFLEDGRMVVAVVPVKTDVVAQRDGNSTTYTIKREDGQDFEMAKYMKQFFAVSDPIHGFVITPDFAEFTAVISDKLKTLRKRFPDPVAVTSRLTKPLDPKEFNMSASYITQNVLVPTVRISMEDDFVDTKSYNSDGARFEKLNQITKEVSKNIDDTFKSGRGRKTGGANLTKSQLAAKAAEEAEAAKTARKAAEEAAGMAATLRTLDDVVQAAQSARNAADDAKKAALEARNWANRAKDGRTYSTSLPKIQEAERSAAAAEADAAAAEVAKAAAAAAAAANLAEENE